MILQAVPMAVMMATDPLDEDIAEFVPNESRYTYAPRIKEAIDPLIEVDPALRARNGVKTLPMTSESMDILGAGQPYGDNNG